MSHADQQPASPPAFPSERPGWTAIAFITACVLTGVVIYLIGARLVRRTSPLSSIAVLPFVSLSADPETERFGDDLTSQITGALATVESLRVADRAAALQFKGKTVNVQDTGRRLGVDVLVQGTVDRSRNRLRVVATLISTVNPYQLWSHTYDLDAQSAAAFESEVSRAIVNAVRIELRAGGSRVPARK